MTNTPRPDSLTARLDREWEHLRHHPRPLRRARSWAAHDRDGPFAERLATLTDLHELLDLTRGRGAADLDADALLCLLIRVAEHDKLAGRVVIQRLLPGLIAKSTRYRDYRDIVEPTEVAIAAAWIAMRRYDWRRRKRHVASSLISDATFQAFRQPLRRRAATEEVRSPHEFKRIVAAIGPGNATDELVVVLRDASAAGVPAGDLDLIRHLVRSGSTRRVADEYGVTPRTIRNRRDAAIARVQEALVAA